MRLGRYDSFMIGICLAFSISSFTLKNYSGIIIQASILGTYFGVNLCIDKFVTEKDAKSGETENGK